MKERVVRVQNLLKTRTIDVLDLLNLLELAVHERSIVAPGPVKQLVAFHTNRETLGDLFVIEQAVAEIGNARPRAARDDLLKGIEWVKGTRRHANFRSGRGFWRCDRNAIDDPKRIGTGRNEDRKIARGFEIARARCRGLSNSLC